MRHEPQRPEPAPRAAPAATAPPSVVTVSAQFLGLQRASGNAAVARAVRAGVIGPPRARLARQPVLVKSALEAPGAYKDAASAANALDSYMALPEAYRRAAVVASYKQDLIRVLAALSLADQIGKYRGALSEIGRWVEEEETRSWLGMTDDQIAAAEMAYLKKEAEDDAAAEAAKKAPPKGPVPKPTQADIQAQAKKNLEETSIASPQKPSGWDAMSLAEKTSWTSRGAAAVVNVVAHAKVKHPELGLTAAMFKVDFKAIELRGANVVAMGESGGPAGTLAVVGFAFVSSVELNPAYVMDVVVHEIFGHPEYGTYGTEYHLALYDAAMAKMPGYVKPAAGGKPRQKEIDAYAYQETEIYSVLRSMQYRTAPKPADTAKVPALDTQNIVTWRVGLMKKQWAPKLVVGILRGQRRRLLIDPRISAAALGVFDTAVRTKFDAATEQAVRQ